MGKVVLCTLAAAELLVPVTAVYAAQTKSVPRNRIIIVGGDYDFPPYSFLDSSGSPTGFCTDLSREIAKVTGLRFQFKLEKWADVRKNLEEGRIQLVQEMAYSKERDKLYDFSIPFDYTTHTIFIKKGMPYIRAEELTGRSILVTRGDIGHDYLMRYHISDRVVVSEDYSGMLRLLDTGRYDCALMQKLPGLYWADHLGLTDIVATNEHLIKHKVCYAVKKGNTRLLHSVNEALTVLGKNGTIDRLYHKWFEIYADRTIPRYDIKKILFWVLTPVVVILGVILLWSASLRRLVRKRTQELQEQNRELQRAKEEILSREKELHLLVASLDDIAMEFDRDGRYMNIWTADDSVLFLPRDQLIGKTIREIFGRDFAQPFETVIPNVLDTGVPDNVDYNVPLDGEVRWFNARISPIEGDTAKRDRVVMLIRDITEKKVIEDALQYSLKEKDVLLKEIHHRVKNNLQIVSSLLSLQISRITEPSVISALEESKNRVRAMAIIHEILYNSDKIGELNFSKYTASLLNNLIATFNRGQVKVSTDIDDIALGLNDAIPCGLIINELVTNSLKHAFEHVDDPAISVSMKNGGPDKSIMLTVQDNGKGIPESFNPEDPDTLGMRLVFSLAQQIGGEVSYSFTEGTRFTITFPLRERGDVL